MPVVTPDIPGAQTALLPRIVQKANAVTSAAGKTLTCAFTNANATGNSIVVVLGMGEVEGAGITLAVTDSNSNTYTEAVKGSQSTTLEAAIFYATGIVAGTNTVTITIAGGSSSTTAIAVEIYEVIGLIAVTPGALDATNTGTNAGSTSVTTSAVVPLIPNELAFIAIASADTTITAGTNWVLDSGTLAPTGGNLTAFGSESQLLTTTASVSGAATLSGSSAWASAIATFKTPILPVEATISGTVNIGNVNPNGQNTMANSAPVVLPSNQYVGTSDGVAQALALEALLSGFSTGPVDSTGKAQMLNIDRIRSWQGKAVGGSSTNITSTLAGDTALVFSVAPKTITPGQAVQLSVANGAAIETVYVATSYVISSSATSIPLQFPVVNAGNTTAKWDVYAPAGATTFGMLPTGMLPVILAAYDPNAALPIALNSGSLDQINPNRYLAAQGVVYAGTSVSDRVRGITTFKSFNAQALTATSGNTPVSIWTPAAGKKFRLMGYWFSVTTAAGLVFHDLASVGGGGVIPLPSPLPAAAGIVQTSPIGNGFISAAANNQLWIDLTIASNVTGFVFGMEE